MEDEEREELEQQSAPFQGSGFRLGDAEGPSQAVVNRPLPQRPQTVSDNNKLNRFDDQQIFRRMEQKPSSKFVLILH